MRDAAASRVAAPKLAAYKPPVLLTAPLSSGATIPQLGLGTWSACSCTALHEP